MAEHMSIVKFRGDPDELLKLKQEKLDPLLSQKASAHGGISHTVAIDEDGLVVVNIWESKESRERTSADPEVLAAIEEAGMPTPEARHYDAVQHITP